MVPVPLWWKSWSDFFPCWLLSTKHADSIDLELEVDPLNVDHFSCTPLVSSTGAPARVGKCSGCMLQRRGEGLHLDCCLISSHYLPLRFWGGEDAD